MWSRMTWKLPTWTCADRSKSLHVEPEDTDGAILALRVQDRDTSVKTHGRVVVVLEDIGVHESVGLIETILLVFGRCTTDRSSC